MKKAFFLTLLTFVFGSITMYCQNTFSFKIDNLHQEIIENKPVISEDKTLVTLDDTELFVYFPGADGATSDKLLLDYISQHVIYPDSARKIGLQGKVIVQFEIGKTGKISNVKIISGGNSIFNIEILRMFSTMPNWVWDKKIKPKDRKNVTRIIPITFSLTD